MRTCVFSLILIFNFSAALLAGQSKCPPKPPEGNAQKSPPTEEVVLPAGTFVILETADRLPSDRAQRGQVVNLRVRTNVVAGGQVVVKSGALALGHVVEVGKNFNYNDPAYIVIAAEQVQAVDGQMLRLNGFPATVSGSEPRTIVLLEPMQMLTASVMNNETIIVKN